MLLLSLNLFGLQLEVLVQPVQSLLLKVDLSLGTSVTDLLVLVELELVQLAMLRDGAQHFESVILL